MMRNIYNLVLVVACVGLPAQARTPASPEPAPSYSSKAFSKSKVLLAPRITAHSSSTSAPTKVLKKSEIVLTSDTSRSSLVTSALSQVICPTAPVTESNPTPPPTRTTRIYSTSETEPMPCLVTRTSPLTTALVTTRSGPVTLATSPGQVPAGERLARVTAYWAGEGDYYTERCISATGVRLHDGHCAVDPNIIPYGSVVEIPGVGKYLAVDTGSAVISRTAAREGGHTYEERHALVIDLFFEDREAGERFAAAAAKYTAISWWTPSSSDELAREARSLFAEEDWTKIQNKQL